MIIEFICRAIIILGITYFILMLFVLFICRNYIKMCRKNNIDVSALDMLEIVLNFFKGK